MHVWVEHPPHAGRAPVDGELADLALFVRVDRDVCRDDVDGSMEPPSAAWQSSRAPNWCSKTWTRVSWGITMPVTMEFLPYAEGHFSRMAEDFPPRGRWTRRVGRATRTLAAKQ